MSFIIKGKEPPKCCAECMFFKKKISFPDYSVSCLLGGKPPEPWPLRYEQRAEDCPIVEIPAHGRLIDADALAAHDNEDFDKSFAKDDATVQWVHLFIQNRIAYAPTIIPAEDMT